MSTSAGDVMTIEPVAVLSGTTLDQAAKIMLRRKLKRLPVLRSGHVVGVVTRFSLLTYATHRAHPADETALWQGEARQLTDLIRGPVPVVQADAGLEEIVDAVTSTRLHEAVVVDADRHILGMISDSELLRRLGPRTEGLLERLMHRRAAVSADRPSTARDLMRTAPIVAGGDMQVANAVTAMIQDGVKVLPVTDAEGRLNGVVDRAYALLATHGIRACGGHCRDGQRHPVSPSAE